MKRSAFFVFNVPKARFIAEGDFILHAPSGALHSAKQKTTRWGGFCLAEKERFELSNGFIRYTISSRAPSTS